MAHGVDPELIAAARDAASAGNGNGTNQAQPDDTRHDWHRRMMHGFEWFAAQATRGAGSPLAFGLAVLVVVVWAVTGPIFHYSETWQLVINTATTIITFIMVFLIQQAQNKDSLAVHLKLNELLASHRHASSRLVAIEDLDEQDLKKLAAFYRQLSELAERENDIGRTHGLDDALQTHVEKQQAQSDREAALNALVTEAERETQRDARQSGDDRPKG